MGNCSDSSSLDTVQGVYATMTPTEQNQQTPAPTTSTVIPTTSTASPTYQSGCNLQSNTFVSDAGISVSVAVDLEADVATITMSGPIGVWWGVGFGQTTMHELYSIIVYEDGQTVEERRLESYGKGVLVSPQIISIENNSVEYDERILVLKRARTGETYNFPNIASSVDLLTGYGAPGEKFATASFTDGYSLSEANESVLVFVNECLDVGESVAHEIPFVLAIVIAIAHVCFFWLFFFFSFCPQAKQADR